MKAGDMVRNKNAHPSMYNSRGVFLGMRMFKDHRERPWKVGGIVEENFYMCAVVLWYGDTQTRTIQTDLIEVVNESR